MESQTQAQILFVVIGIVAALGLWYLAMRFRQPKLRVFAVLIGAMPVLAVGLNLGSSWFGWGVADTYKTFTPGPATREPSVKREFPFPVTDSSLAHQVELTPRAQGGETATGAVRLHMTVLSPKGETLAEREESLGPAQGRYWSTLRAEFQPREEGDFTLRLEIPQPVSEVRVAVRELRRK